MNNNNYHRSDSDQDQHNNENPLFMFRGNVIDNRSPFKRRQN